MSERASEADRAERLQHTAAGSHRGDEERAEEGGSADWRYTTSGHQRTDTPGVRPHPESDGFSSARTSRNTGSVMEWMYSFTGN